MLTKGVKGTTYYQHSWLYNWNYEAVSGVLVWYEPVFLELVEVGSVPLWAKVEVTQHLWCRIQLPHHDQHLLVDECPVLPHVKSRWGLQPLPHLDHKHTTLAHSITYWHLLVDECPVLPRVKSRWDLQPLPHLDHKNTTLLAYCNRNETPVTPNVKCGFI